MASFVMFVMFAIVLFGLVGMPMIASMLGRQAQHRLNLQLAEEARESAYVPADGIPTAFLETFLRLQEEREGKVFTFPTPAQHEERKAA